MPSSTKQREDIQFTQNFRLHEFLVSKNYPKLAERMIPTPLVISNLHKLCYTILQPVRTWYGYPIHSLSGFRDGVLNPKVSKWPGSLHTFGEADDFTVDRPADLIHIYHFINRELAFAWVQLILYNDRNFIHVGLPHMGYSHLREER